MVESVSPKDKLAHLHLQMKPRPSILPLHLSVTSGSSKLSCDFHEEG